MVYIDSGYSRPGITVCFQQGNASLPNNTHYEKVVKMYPQDLHIHTTYSANDSAIVPEQTVSLIARVKHARTVGISDHFENLTNTVFEHYQAEVRAEGLKLGTEVDGHDWARAAGDCAVDYYIYHCYDSDADYRGAEYLLATGKPVIIAHPNALDTNMDRLPPECLIEINNRYVWRCNWQRFYGTFKERFKFIISSDAHQPNWLGQSIARFAAREMGLKEELLFAD